MKKSLLVSLLLILSFNLFAIGFGYQVLDVRTSPNFYNNSFPLSVRYQFNFPVPDIYPGNTTLCTFRLDNGLDERRLYQNPKDGRFIDDDESLVSEFKNPDARDYTTQFDEFLLVIEQGLFGKDLIKLHFSFGGRFEKAFERWDWMFDNKNTEGLFWKAPGVARYIDVGTWYGVPELRGDRGVTQTMLNFGLSFNLLQDTNTVRNGIALDVMYRYSPAKIQIFEGDDPTADFTAMQVNLSLAATPVKIYQKNGERTNFSIQIGNDASYKYVQGTKVPYYMQGDSIYGTYVPNAEHSFTDETYLAFFGPQLGADDLYAYLKLFHNAGISYGKAMNTKNEIKVAEYSGSVGFRAEFNIYNICRCFYQVGYLYSAPFNGKTGSIEATLGFTVEV